MNNILSCTEKAVRALEQIFTKANWQDGYGYDKNGFIRNNLQPLFFRNSAPPITSDFEVRLPNMTHTFFALYNIIGAENVTACNKTKVVKVRFAIAIFTDDPFIFAVDCKISSQVDSRLANFMSNLLDGLEDNQWGYSLESQSAIEATDGGSDFCYRTIYMVENYF